MKKLLLSLALLVGVASTLWAEEVTIDGIKYSLVSKAKQATVIAGDSKYSGSVVIPASVTYNGANYSVTSIGSYAFAWCSGLTSVTIPNSVTSIGGSAFSGCSGLTSVTTPNSVTSIGEGAFSNCKGLTSVTIPNSVTSIGEWAFSNCSGLTSVTIPNSVTSIGYQAFKGCSKLTSVTIPNSVTSIGKYAFRYCSDLASVTIPGSVTKIGWYAFSGCKDLTSLVCKAVTPPTLGDNVFENVPTSTGTLYVPASAVSAYKSENQWQDWETVISLPSSVTLSATEMTLWIGRNTTLTATVSDKLTDKKVTWSSSDATICSVFSGGTLYPKKVGTATITATASDGSTATCTVTVRRPVTSIGLSADAVVMAISETRKLIAYPYPANAYCLDVVWSSSDESVATVSEDGVVTPVNTGQCTITCTSADGNGAAKSCEVKVALKTKISDTDSYIPNGTYDAGVLSYAKSLAAGKYYSICLPFDVDLSQNAEKINKAFTLRDVAMLNANGVLTLLCKELEMTEIIPAGQPFVIVAGKDAVVTWKNHSGFTMTGQTAPTPIALDVYDIKLAGLSMPNRNTKITLCGTYTELTGMDSENTFSINSSATLARVSMVSPFRMYVEKDANTQVQEIILSLGEDEATAILNLDADTLDTDAPLYNLQGQRVTAPVKGQVYIQNGKKVRY